MTATMMILIGLLALLLVAAAAIDIRTRTIPNGLNLAVALLAIPFWWASGIALWPDIALQIGLALVVFAAFAGFFALGAMGGGDVKLIGALALWLPWPALLAVLFLMSVAGAILTLVMVGRHRLLHAEGRPEIPYGVAIAAGGLWVITEPFLNHFGR